MSDYRPELGNRGLLPWAAPAPAPVSDAEKAARVAALPAPYNTADLANGKADARVVNELVREKLAG